MIGKIVAEAINLCRSEEAYFDEVAQKVTAAMTAELALDVTLEKEVQSAQQARRLLIEMLNGHLDSMNFYELEEADSLAKVVHNIALHSEAIFVPAIIAGIPEYEALLTERTAKYGESDE